MSRKLRSLAVCLMAVLGLLITVVALDVPFTQQSIPPAIVPDTSVMVSTGSVVTTVIAPTVSYGASTNRFTHWTLNGVRQSDATGRGINPVTFTVTDPITYAAVAHYTPDATDANTNNIPDWVEYHFYGALTNATADTDSDGLNLLTEFNRDTHPNIPDTTIDGGISQRASPQLIIIQATNIVPFQIQSIPPGIISTNIAVPIGSTQVLPDLNGLQYGYRFAQWLVNGVRIEDSLGVSVGNLTLTITTNTTAIAQFISDTADADGDGVPDWFEYHYFGATNYNASYDYDGDGLTMLDEFTRDTHAGLKDTISDGGISQRGSALISYVDLAYASCHLISSPLGFIDTTYVVLTNTTITLPELYGITNGYRFAQWNLGDIRLADPLNRGTGNLTLTIPSNTTVTALYLLATTDTNTNNIPDWFEYHYNGALTNATADTDGDGLNLLDEYIRDTHPGLKDTTSDGGISQRGSALTFIDLRQYSYYKITSSPTGFVYETGYVPNDTVITTPTAALVTNGYAFGHWDVNGYRQQNPDGTATNPASFIPITTTTATAFYYLLNDDTDSDGIPDWWEDRWFGGTTAAIAAADPDGDALTNLEEYQGGSNPLVADRTILAVDWSGGAGNWTNSLKWTPAIVPSDILPTNFVVYIDHGNSANSVVTQNVAITLLSLKVDGSDWLCMQPGAILTLHPRLTSGSITNAGLITLNGTAAGTSELRVANGILTVAGSGTIALSDHTNNIIRATTTNAWFRNTGNLIRGSGNLGANTLGILNAGSIIANQATPLILDPADTLGFTNTGTVQVNTGSVLVVQGPGFIQTAGTLPVYGTLIASNGLTIAGGLLTGGGTNIANIANNGTLAPGAGLGGLTIIGSLTQQTNATLAIELGGHTAGINHDLVTVTGAAAFAGTLRVSLTNNFAQTITNGATFTVLTAASITGAFTNVPSGGTLATPDGAFQFTAQYSGASLILTLQQIVDTDSDQLPNWWELLYFANPTNANPTADPDGDGLTNLEEYSGRSNPTVGDRTVRAVDWVGGPGNWSDIAKWNPGIVPNDTPPTNFVVNIDHGNGASSIVTQDVSATIERFTLDAGDTLRLLPGTVLTIHKRLTSGTITNAGLLALDASELRFANGNGTLTGSGTITLSDNTNNFIRGTGTTNWLYNLNNTITGSGNLGADTLGIRNAGAIIANQAAPLILDPSDTLGCTNTGLIQINTGSALTIAGPGFVQTTGSLLLNGTLTASNGLAIAGGLLAANGAAIAHISNNGTLAPGAFSLTGNLTQQTNATLAIELGGYVPGSGFDTISVSGTATFAGTLTVTITNNFIQTVTNGATFTVLTAAAINGVFTNVASGGTLTTADGTAQLTVQYGGSNLVLSVQFVDTDSDLMPDWWEDLHGFSKTNPGDAAQDADADGMTNLHEYLAGTDPQSGLSRLGVFNLRRVGGDWRFDFSSVSGKTYRVEYTPNLKTTNAWPILHDNLIATGAVFQIVDPTATGATNRFYRIRLKQ